MLDSIKYDLRRYLKRERKKPLPGDSAYWEFECKFGKDSVTAEEIKVSEIIPAVDRASEEGWDEFYIEIFARASEKLKQSPASLDNEAKEA